MNCSIENIETHIEKKKQILCAEWEFKQNLILQRMEQACHWQNDEAGYHEAIREYYLQRQQHQKEVMRLNQILYGPYHPEIMSSSRLHRQPCDSLTPPLCQNLSEHAHKGMGRENEEMNVDHSYSNTINNLSKRKAGGTLEMPQFSKKQCNNIGYKPLHRS